MKTVAHYVVVPFKMFGLAFWVMLMPQATLARIGCFGPDQHPITQEIVALPGQDNYDSARYGRLIYAHAERCLKAQDCLLLMGELKVKWPTERPLPHVEAEASQMRNYRENSDWVGYSVHFDYSEFYEFTGDQFTARGLSPIAPDYVDATAGAAEEGYWIYPLETRGPMVFPATFHKAYDILRLTVEGVGQCSMFPLPAPDRAAIDELTACIANDGCK